jgi:predicted metal-binding protein
MDSEKDYIVVVQCDISLERCSGYACEKAFTDRSGGFTIYPREKPYRTMYLSCGGCCGRALHRKLVHLSTKLQKKENIGPERLVVHLSTCITKESHHHPACPYLADLKSMVSSAGLDCREDTYISLLAEKRRAAGQYAK